MELTDSVAVDRATVENVLRAMSEAHLSLEDLAAATLISQAILVSRLTRTSSFKARELGLIAIATGTSASDLVASTAQLAAS